MVHFPTAHNSQDYSKPKPTAENSVQVSQAAGRNTVLEPLLLFPRDCINNKFASLAGARTQIQAL